MKKLRLNLLSMHSIVATLLVALIMLSTGSLTGCIPPKDLTLEELVAEIISKPDVKQFQMEKTWSSFSTVPDQEPGFEEGTEVYQVDKVSKEIYLKTETMRESSLIIPGMEDTIDTSYSRSKDTYVIGDWVYEYWNTPETPGVHRDPWVWYKTPLNEVRDKYEPYYLEYDYALIFDNEIPNLDHITMLGNEAVNGVDCYKLGIDVEQFLPENIISLDQTYKYYLWIDKNSFRVVKIETTTTTFNSEGTIKREDIRETVFSNIDDVSITLPKEAQEAVRVY